MNILTSKQQDYNIRRCKYCSGTGKDIFNKSEPCPHCIKLVVIKKDLEQELKEEEMLNNDDAYLEYINQEVRSLNTV